MQPGPLGDEVARHGRRAGHHHRIRLDDLPALRAISTRPPIPELKKNYIDTGKVRFIFREFPLDPLAAAAFMLARCAGKDKYFPLIETLFQQQQDWAVQKPLAAAVRDRQAGRLHPAELRRLPAGPEDARRHRRDRARARASKFKVNSTPTFFINGKIYRGALTIEELAKADRPAISRADKRFLNQLDQRPWAVPRHAPLTGPRANSGRDNRRSLLLRNR